MLEGRLEDVNRKNVGGELYENMVLEKDKVRGRKVISFKCYLTIHDK
jgi:hypothetical protein